MYEHVEVIRLESQLTVPTRNRRHLSDVWVAIASRARLSVWADALKSVADTFNTRCTGSGTVQLVRMSDQRGWIVVRGVDLRQCSPSDIEQGVRDLVNLTNSAVGMNATTSPAALPTSSWAYTVRSALKAGGNVAMVVVAGPRRRAKIDASSAG